MTIFYLCSWDSEKAPRHGIFPHHHLHPGVFPAEARTRGAGPHSHARGLHLVFLWFFFSLWFFSFWIFCGFSFFCVDFKNLYFFGFDPQASRLHLVFLQPASDEGESNPVIRISTPFLLWDLFLSILVFTRFQLNRLFVFKCNLEKRRWRKKSQKNWLRAG